MNEGPSLICVRYGGRSTGLLRAGILIAGVLLLLVLTCAASAAQAFDPAYEARNYAKINERARSDYTPAFDAQLAAQGAENEAQGAQILASDGPQDTYGRDPTGNLCFHHMNGCAGDIRLYDWGAKGYGDVVPVLFTQRNGATLSGHVWMTRAGPEKRPGVVIVNGSIQAPEQLYWYAAETLAKDGYVVLTFDPQGQGYSDTYGEGVDRMDGVPSQDGGPFFFGTEDALDFFFSTPEHPYVPRPSCSSGTSHEAKQKARVAAGLDSALQPVLEPPGHERSRPRRTLPGGRGRLLHRPARPAGESDRRLGQPLRRDLLGCQQLRPDALAAHRGPRNGQRR